MDPAVLPWVRAAHVFGFVLWTGGLCALTMLLSSAPGLVALSRAGKRIAMLADIGAAIAIAAGVAMTLGIEPSPMSQGWMHVKLTIVVVGLLGLHGFSRVKLKRAQSAEGATVSPLWSAAVIAVVAAIIVLAIARPI